MSGLRVGVDALGLRPVGGARKATIGLLRALAGADQEVEYVVFLSRHEPELEPFSNVRARVVPGLGTRLRLRLWAQVRLPLLLRSDRTELVHFMKNLSVFGAPHPRVITILDVNRFRVPHGYSKLDIILWRTVQPHLLRSADRIVAISETTKRDLVLEYRLPPETISVIYPGSDLADGLPPHTGPDRARAELGLPPHFVLSVGGLATHKNLYTLLRAFFDLKKKWALPHKLVLVGGRYHPFSDPRIPSLLEADAGGDVFVAGVLSDRQLVSTYRAADLFVSPSLYEGFGLAPLEAMACGVPVIVSRRGALEEVVGDAGLYTEDPLDEGELSQLMARVLENRDLAEEMRERGKRRASLFSWRRSAEMTLRLYREVLSGE